MGDGKTGASPRFRRAAPAAAGLLLVFLLGLALPVAAQQRAEVLPRFEDGLVATVDAYPTDLAWMGGDLLIATIGGILYRVDGANPDAAPAIALDLRDVVGTGQEQGMVGVVADPMFSVKKNRFLYIFYTRDEGGCSTQYGVPPPDPAKCFNRLSRFLVTADGVADPASEQPLLERIPVGLPNHNGGDVAFGKDGMLYVTTGDGGVDAANGAAKAQDLGNLHGKILRIRRDGSAPKGNPFAGKNGVSCAKSATATAPPGKRCAEIFAYGLRNPYRFAFDPNARGARFFVNDVGEETWEEINAGKAGANYGWPLREGPCAVGKSDDCAGTNPKEFAAPIHAYNHSTQCMSITGGAFVPKTSDWGRGFRGRYLFGDWTCGTMFSLQPQPKGKGFAATWFAWPDMDRPDAMALTALLFDPKGNTLYYAAESDGEERSQIRSIRRKD